MNIRPTDKPSQAKGTSRPTGPSTESEAKTSQRGTTPQASGPDDGFRASRELSREAAEQRPASMTGGDLPFSPTNRPDFGSGYVSNHGAPSGPGIAEFLGTEPSPARVAVLDIFPGFGQNQAGSPPTHGQQVMNVLTGNGGIPPEDIRGFQMVNPFAPSPQGLLTAPGDATSSERLDSYLEARAAGFLQTTNRNLSIIAGDPNSNIRTINQSMGQNPAAMAKELAEISYERNEDNTYVTNEDGARIMTPEGRVIYEGLGLPAEDTPGNNVARWELAAARAAQVQQTSPVVLQELARHQELSQTLQEQGVTYVVAAGNEDRIASLFEAEGREMPEGFLDGLITNPYNVTVGATNDNQTLDPRDDVIANFSSQDPETDVLAAGVGVQVGPDSTNSGTSFSAPLVAARLDALRLQNPTMPADQLFQLLASGHSTSILGSDLPVVQ